MKNKILVAAVLLAGFVSAPLMAQTATAPSQAKASAPATSPSPPKSNVAAPLDINTAAKSQLLALKGVGDVRAEAIVKGRPYKGKDDLVARKILPAGVYEGIKSLIVARQK